MRLDKYIADCGFAARREAKKLIKSGTVCVNGITASDIGMKVDEESDKVTVGGTELRYRKFVYLMLNKPAGYVSAVEDKHYKTVLELLPSEYAHYNVSPVGRLDIDTEGLLILSNDGQFIHNVITPKKNVFKRYFAILDKPCGQDDIDAFSAGMVFKDFRAMPAHLEITENKNCVFIEIAEGKYHQVKRMCERVGKTVTYLKRVKIGGLELDENLPAGRVRELTKHEIDSIFFCE